jgi:coproporphyrinogen III oxidase-like Fe-S oxidoreductase
MLGTVERAARDARRARRAIGGVMPSELEGRLALVRTAIDRTLEPLDVPLGIVFRPLDGDEHLRAWSERAARAQRGDAFAPATLYVHVPFCARVCTYCLLSAVRTPGKDAVAAYVGALRRQIALYEPIVRGLRFGSLHLGGGTPTLLDEAQLDRLFTDLSRLPLAENARIGVEAHPATSTPGRLGVLRKHGVHRVSFGVETLTPEVLRNVNREDQNDARVRAAVNEARRLGFTINIDLLAGLPGETEESWRETVAKTITLEPDSLSVNRFLGENSSLDRFGFAPDDDENRRVDRMLMDADVRIRELAPPRWPEEALARPGFGTQYGWERGESARRYFQDDMIGPVSTLAIGHGALGHVYGRHFSVAAGSIADYVAALDRGAPPAMLASPIDERFEMAFFAADHACRGTLSLRTFHGIFRQDLRGVFPHELAFLLERGLLTAKGDRLSKPARADFQLLHLLAFFLRDSASLERDIAKLAERVSVRRSALVTLRRGGDVGSIFTTPDAPRAVEVADGLDGATATALASAAKEHGVALDVQGDDRRTLRQYEAIGAELPPSMLWVRIAIRASQASRGEQRAAAPIDAPLPDLAPPSTV